MPLEEPEITEFTGAAAGLPSVLHALRVATREMGVVRSAATLLKVNQVGGFDCPGCAWPEGEHRSTFEFCENGAKAVAAEATTRRVGPEFFRDWPVSKLRAQSDFWLESQGRLTTPMILRAGTDRYEPCSWDLAFSQIAEALNALLSPDEAVFYTSGRTSNEAAFLYQLFVRSFGTNNLPDCSNMCHESSGAGMSEAIGVGKGTVTLADFEEADALFILGQNPGTNHPRMLATLEAAARRGCTIVSINPLKEAGLVRFAHPQQLRGVLGHGTAITDLYLQVRINGDVALLQGIMKEILDAEKRNPGSVLDWDFIRSHTSGFERFAAALEEVSWEDIVEESGIAREEIRQAADIYMRSRKVICCWAMGLTQHKNGVGNVQEVVNLLLLKGNIGRPGAGPCPVRGHSNVQGDRTMGISENPKAAFLDRLGRVCGFQAPRTRGYSTVEAIRAMGEGKVGVFFALGGNFHSATPDTEYVARGLARCGLTVQVSTKLNRSHLVTGQTAIILPCLGRTERDETDRGLQYVTVEDSMSMVHASRGHLKPASPLLRSEPAIVAGLASATLQGRSTIPWTELAADYDRIRELIEKVIPGFEQFNARAQVPGGFLLPNTARDRTFSDSGGRAHFTVHPLPRLRPGPGFFTMMTIRSHDQYNTTVYGMNDRYRGIRGTRRVVLVHREDLLEAGLKEGQQVDIRSLFRGESRIARGFRVVGYDLPRKNVATYFPEANCLIPAGSFADGSLTPTSKSVIVELIPHTAPLPEEDGP